ncbi:MAG: SDR family NAD(P)-dependent oxidoreductase [Ruminococcus flavefaciens]|nr:SDR family NAD(P)-dependent oxidoreductase [Ruminococcus flavefaciens]
MKKTIFIVGAGKGLGNAIGRKFGENDFRVVLMSRNSDSLNSYAEEFKAKGIEVYTKVADASDDNTMTAVLNEAVAEYGIPDVFAYNVGVTSPDSTLENGVTPEILRERYQVDVVGAYHCIQQIATEDFAKKNGAIFVTGGGLAMYPSAEYLPLSMDKAALRAMIQALHPVMQEKGIFLGTLTVCNVITEGSSCAPEILAEKYWQQYTERKNWEIICQ